LGIAGRLCAAAGALLAQSCVRLPLLPQFSKGHRRKSARCGAIDWP